MSDDERWPDRWTIDLKRDSTRKIIADIRDVLQALIDLPPHAGRLDAGQEEMLDQAFRLVDSVDTELIRDVVGEQLGEDEAWDDEPPAGGVTDE